MDTFGLHLHQCTFNENETVLSNLVKTDNDLNQRDERGETATHVAAKFNKVKALKILLDGGANIKAVNKERRNVLHIAIENNKFQCIYLLLELDLCASIVNKIDCHGLSPLMIAIEKNEKLDISLRHEQQKLIQLLINHRFMEDIFLNIDSSMRSKYDSHFQCAIECKNEFAIDCMIKKAQESFFSSLISSAMFEDLITLRPDIVYLKNEKEQTLLHQAILSVNLPYIELLIKNNADCNSSDFQLCSPLHLSVDQYNDCCTEGYVQTCYEKLENCNEIRETYLVTSTLFNNGCVHLAVIVYLINAGNADIFAENSEGKTIFDYFVDEYDICEYLLSAVIKNSREKRFAIPAYRYTENMHNIFVSRMKNFNESNNVENCSIETKYYRENIALEIILSEMRDEENIIDSCIDQEIFNCYFTSLQKKYKQLLFHYTDEQETYSNIVQSLEELMREAQFWNSFYFEKGFAEDEQYGNEVIHDACLHNDVNLLRNTLKRLKNVEISETNDNGENALHVAVKYGSLECIKLFILENVKYGNICDYKSNTQMDHALRLCLHCTSILRNRRAQIVAFLLDSLDKVTQFNSTTLVRSNLLPNSVDDLPVQHFDAMKLFSIYYAAYHGRSEIIIEIFQKFTFLDLEDNIVRQWITASLKTAADKKYLHIVELLICKIVSDVNVGTQLLESCWVELISSYESICCLEFKKCNLISILQKCVKLRKIYKRTSAILPHPVNKCSVPALIVFLIEFGCIVIRKEQFSCWIKTESVDYSIYPYLFKRLFDFYAFVSENKEKNIVFEYALDEKSEFDYCSPKTETNKTTKKKKCCVQ